MANGMVVKNNLSALNTLNIMNSNQTATNKQMKKVSSGMKINGAADDASGYQISERMRVQIRSLDQANQNTQNGSSLMKTAEGAVSSTVEILKTLKEKVINAANGVNTEQDLKAIQQEMNQSIDQINDNAAIQFNGKYLIDGSLSRETNLISNVYTNNQLGQATATTASMTALKDRSGNALNIVDGDKVTVSYVINGKTTTASITINSTTTLGQVLAMTSGTASSAGGTANRIGVDASGDSVYTADGSTVLTVTSNGGGFDKAISGFTISVSDSKGNIKKDVNKILDAFSETISAEDKTNDDRLILQVGTKSNQSIAVSIRDMGAQALGLQGASPSGLISLNVSTKENATTAINVVDAALQRALTEQTNIGAVQSRLDYTSTNLTTASENVTNSESTIRDADMAKEMTEYTKNNILKQTAQAMLAQANQSGSGVLSLLQ